ncbi:MAG: hypothetical protein WDW36_001254 [Sanguina aurantia]
MTTLLVREFFPSFRELPMLEEYDNEYFAEQPQGGLLPSRTWTFTGEVVCDELSRLPMLGNRVEVRDVSGERHSILFFPTSGTLDFTQLQSGATLFIRYASRVFFSDLSTEAIRVEDLDMVKIIPFSFDTLLAVSSMFFASHTQDSCMCCHSDLAALGGSAPRCSGCQAAVYCSDACRSEDAPLHSSYCALCDDLRDVLSIDFERFIEYIPFRVSPS